MCFLGDLAMRLSPRVARLRGEGGRADQPGALRRARRDLVTSTSGKSAPVLDALEEGTLFKRVDAVEGGVTRQVVPLLARAIESDV